MALIDFKCTKCNKEFFEIIRDLNEKVICPECGSTEVERVYKGKYYGKGGNCTGSCSCCGGGCK